MLGQCLCERYGCVEGRCFRRAVPRDPDQCYLQEDECTETTCHTYECGRGVCRPGVANCVEGVCVPDETGVLRDCHRGRCAGPLAAWHYAAPDCAQTAQAALAEELLARRVAKCSAATLGSSVGALSASVLSERVVGEESVDYHTPLLSMMTFKRSAESEAVRGKPLTSAALPASAGCCGCCG